MFSIYLSKCILSVSISFPSSFAWRYLIASKAITYYLKFIDELYSFIKDNQSDSITKDKEEAKKIIKKYKRITQHHGAEIKEIYHITREESFPHLYENADFSLQTIKDSIDEGELKTNKLINNINNKGKPKTIRTL